MTKRCRVGFALMSEHSSFHAALGLARSLQARGHEPVFFVDAGTVFPALVRKHGFRVADVPAGHDAYFAAPPAITRYRLIRRLKRRAQHVRAEQAYLVDAIRANGLDLCLLDAVRYDLYPLALALRTSGVPAMLLSYTFASRCRLDHPPVFSSALVSHLPATAARRFANAARWAWAIATRGRGDAFSARHYASMTLGKWLEQARNTSFERSLRALGVSSSWSEWKRRPDLPELVFGHRALDWPAIAADADRCYLGVTDLLRTAEAFDASRLDPAHPTVYANVSTINGFQNIRAEVSGGLPDLTQPRFRIAKRYVEALVACFTRRPEWQLLLACGPFASAFEAASLPRNIQVFERLPQLAVLPHVDTAVTWGGAGTVRVCVNHGVPMVVLPAWTDQFGNAARVAAAGAGVRGCLDEVTPEALDALIERTLTDPSFRERVAALRGSKSVDEEVADAIAFIGDRTGVRLDPCHTETRESSTPLTLAL